MVAVIKPGKSLHRSFFYNENKVSDGKATLLQAVNYPLEAAQMDQHMRLNMLLKTASTAPHVQFPSMHITLNFAPGENLTQAKLQTIAAEYMQAIGFGDQPYLVYEHNDAGHPHIHIVTTKIKANGRCISTQNNARKLSEPIRKDIELRHGLVRAEDHRRGVFRLRPADVSRAQYGKSETRAQIATVLEHVLTRYSYSSLTQLNALLGLYNVKAETGAEGSRLHQYEGLNYRLLGADGQPEGVPIKASLFHNRPTLKYLRKRFLLAGSTKQKHADALRATIRRELRTPNINAEKFLRKLKRQGIDVVRHINGQGRMYGITYIDHRSKTVFNGSDLGAEFSANAIGVMTITHPQVAQNKIHRNAPLVHRTSFLPGYNGHPSHSRSVWEILSEHIGNPDQVPYQFLPKRRKKKKQ